MTAIVIFNFYVAFMLAIVSNGGRAETNNDILDKMAKKGTIINGIFKLSVNGSLGSGCYGTAYKGRIVPLKSMEVAMKFSSFNRIQSSRKEFEFYTYLNATNNPNVVSNGIPAIYYFGKWNNHTLLAMTLLNSEFQQRVKAGKIEEVDVLIAFREFVRTMKYIHSNGIIHGDIHLNNLIIQNGHCFIFDFGRSLDMNQYTREENIQYAKFDFRRFLEAMFTLVQPRTNWHWLELSQHKDVLRMKNKSNFIDFLLKDAGTNEATNFRGLRRIFVEFAKNVINNNSTGIKDANGTWIPFYDQLYQVIYEECKIHGSEASTSTSSISSIPDPFGKKKWTRPKVDYQLFENMYADQIRDAKKKGFFCGLY